MNGKPKRKKEAWGRLADLLADDEDAAKRWLVELLAELGTIIFCALGFLAIADGVRH